MKKGSWKRKRGLYPHWTRVREILELAEFRRKKAASHSGFFVETLLKKSGGIMTDNEFLAQMILQAQNLRDEVEAWRAIDFDAMFDRVFDNNFYEQTSSTVG